MYHYTTKFFFGHEFVIINYFKTKSKNKAI